MRSRLPALLLLTIGLLFLFLGVCQGEAEIVFRKATNLCLECIGLG
ncbi:MAG: thioredoxin [Firmicutes bacterium]|nr:thioredoxin [Bacillota bacterium]